MAVLDLESKQGHSPIERETGSETPTSILKLDPHGFPLRPQPSDDSLDPLNWSPWFKLFVLLQISVLAMVNFMVQAIQNPTFNSIAKSYHVSVTQASWTTSIAILTTAFAPLFWAPISNVYGRRPIYIYVTIIGVVASAGSALASEYATLIAARLFVGIGASTANGIGGSVVADLYCQHERGFYMGIYVLFVGNGAHVASLVGGPVGQYLGFRWCFWVATILLGAVWIINLICLPETLYRRDPSSGLSLEKNGSMLRLFTFTGVTRHRKLKAWDFAHCLIMLKYPSVLLAGLYYSIALGLGSVLFALTGAAAFGGIYHFDILQIGLAIGLPTLIGTALGELLAGRLSDYILFLFHKRTGILVEETRLYCTIPGALLLPIGVIIEGVTLQYRTHWIGPLIGMGIGSFGFQVIATNTFAYLTDCYKPQSAEVSSVLNLGRMLFSFTLGFYMVPFAMETTWGIAFSVMAVAHFVLFGGVVLLIWKGKEWRERMGAPVFSRDL